MENLNSCGCCEGISAETPMRIYNRPGLSAIAYRVGDHPTFRESLLTALTTSKLPVLRKLTTRSNDDFTVALLDSWAAVSDVLTFYQERIANESYLGTATEQLSIVELARLIGYELRPGVAAGTYLAFTIEETTMAASQAAVSGNTIRKEEPVPSNIPVGTKVQSVPGPDETPQTFETVESLEARAAWNALRPRMRQWVTDFTAESNGTLMTIKGIDNDLKPGDMILVVNSGNNPFLKKIVKVQMDEADKTTSLYFNPEAANKSYQEPDLNLIDGNGSDFQQKSELDGIAVNELLNKDWHEEDLATFIESQGWSSADLKENIARKLSEPPAAAPKVFVFRKRAFLFGHNAPKQVSYTGSVPDLPSAWPEWAISETNSSVYLDGLYEQILPGSYIAIQKSTGNIEIKSAVAVEFLSRTAYGISAKSTLITIDGTTPWWVGNASNNIEPLRSMVIHVQSEPLTLAESPVTAFVSGDIIELDGIYLGLKAGRPVHFFGERDDLRGVFNTELKTVKAVFVVKGYTVLLLSENLKFTYVRKTVTINANVVAATHGETVKEVLGSGDAGKAFQKFVLKQPPLTFISAVTPSGTQSTLEVRVNDILWHEVPSLYAHGPHEHIYITRQDDQANTTVIFGDGINGARLPTGQENIRATYRKGIGVNGLVKANQLSQLVTRPLGAKAVTNPVATGGSQDREIMAEARRNATLTIFTLGRIVSLQDYEDFARAFAGISKALATWTWHRQKREVYITVAGYNGAIVDNTLSGNLMKAIKNAGIPDVHVTLDTYMPRFFRIEASIAVHPDYLPDKVMAAVERNLRGHFSFAERDFGQSVAFSEVISIIQNTAGVIAVDIDKLHRTSEDSSTSEDILEAKVPTPGAETTSPAEILTLDSSPLVLKLMS